MKLDALSEALLVAHDENDMQQLVTLYRQAGLLCIEAKDVDAGCFYLTHAYIFALEAGMPVATEIHLTLVAYGREE